MADELSFGSVPPYYREVYEIVCPNPATSKVDRDVFVSILKKSKLPNQTLSSIWDAVDNKSGYLTRNGLYKALALCALAQQGKGVNEKLLENFSGQELPKPSLGDLSDLRTLSVQVKRERSPNLLSFNYRELVKLDTVTVELAPEKKGLLLKHVEYEVRSEFYKTSVMRRYNDFGALSEMLISRFPYRMVPKLPPKKMIGANREFIESRRKSLIRFLTLVIRHPTFHKSEIVKYFLTYQGSDMQHTIRQQFRGLPDEFVTSQLAAQAKDLVPMDTQVQLGNSREQIRNMFNGIAQMKQVVDQMALRSTSNASDMLLFAKELNGLSTEAQPTSTWAMGVNQSWPKIKDGLKSVSVEFAALSDKYARQGKREADTVAEKLAFVLDLLQSYKDLCDRHEKGVLRDHQAALAKMGAIKKKKMSATLGGGERVGEVEQLESRILEQESQIMTMENRNYYSLHCLQMETQLIHANIEILAEIMQAFSSSEVQGHQELLKVWQDLEPKCSILSVSDDSNGTPSSPTRLTPNSPTSNTAPGIRF